MNAREQIVRVLEEVFEQGAYSNIALNQALEHSQLCLLYTSDAADD